MNANLSWGNNFTVLSASIPLSATNAEYFWKKICNNIKKNYYSYKKSFRIKLESVKIAVMASISIWKNDQTLRFMNEGFFRLCSLRIESASSSIVLSLQY